MIQTIIYTVPLSTTPTRICPENPNRVELNLIASTGVTARITSTQDQDPTTGYPVSDTIPLLLSNTKGALWATVASSTGTLYVWENSAGDPLVQVQIVMPGGQVLTSTGHAIG